MKDFVKSIRTMNSNKEEIIKKKKEKGATLKVDNGQKLEFSDGTTYVKTSFSEDYREAKNYTGNSKVGNAKWSILEVYSPHMPDDGRYVGSVEASTETEAKQKFVQEKPEYNGKTLIAVKVMNESIEKQEWSMFKGLAKDAEKEVGNKKYHIWTDNGTWDRIVDEAELERLKTTYVNFHYEEVGNKKVGNKSIDDELKELEKDLQTAKHDLNYMKKYGQDTKGSESRVKDLEAQIRLLYSMKSRGYNSKTGNARSKEQLLADVRELTKYIQEHNGQGCEKEKRLLGEAKEELDKNYGVIVGNEKVVNSQTYINGEWKDTKSPKEQLIEYAKKSNDPEYLEHVKKMTNPNDINARLQWHKKSGNETAEEKKFGHVMREFFSGELKSSSGETVTNPEQAKAIAYSEAEKVDNLKRARNSIKKG